MPAAIDPTVKRAPPSLAAVVLLLALLPVCAWVLWQAQRTVRADLGSLQARVQVTAWANGTAAKATADDVAEAQASIERAVQLTPDSPAMQERLGDVHFVQAQQAWDDKAVRLQQLALAESQYRLALQLRPSEPQTWAMLATVLQGQEASVDQVHQAWETAAKLGPYEGHVMPALLQVVLGDWAGATPAMQDWAKKQFDDGAQPTRRAINAMAARYGLQFNADDELKP